MKFLYPQFLYALALVAIPIIIHLFNFRKFKTVYFSNVQFLKSVKEKTKSQSQLKHLLILLSRILAITALVFAFAQPYIPIDESSQKAKKHAVSIYIDNSFSMDAENENGRLLLTAKQQAQAIADAYSNTDEFYLLDNDFKAINQRALNKELFSNAMNAVESSARTHSLNQIYKRQKNTLEKSIADKKDIYILSDFQNSISDLSIGSEDSMYSVRFIPLYPYKNANLYIDSCWLSTPNPQQQKNIKLFARVKNNNSDKKREANITLEVNGQQKAIASEEIAKESIVELNFNVADKGWHKGKISLQDYPITFDDNFYFSFEVKPQLNIQHIFQEKAQPSIAKLFADDDYFNLSQQNANQINYSNLEQSQLIILDGLEALSSGLQQSLKTAVKKGSSLLVFPNTNQNQDSYKTFSRLMNLDSYGALNTEPIKIKSLDNQHPLFEGVFQRIEDRLNFPIVKQYYSLKAQARSSAIPILSFENNNGFINEYAYAKGKIYLSSVGLNKSFGNFSQHALFVPILYNLASYSGGKQDLFYTVGQENIPISSANFDGSLTVSNSSYEFIPESSGNGLWISDQISLADHYALKNNSNTLAYLSFNYNRAESDLSLLDSKKLRTLSEKQANVFLIDNEIDNLSQYLEDLNTGIPLWLSCILFTLFFLFVETLLIRLL